MHLKRNVMQKKKKISIGYIALGLLSVWCGIDSYITGWDFKYRQPTSKIGSIALILFGIIILLFELKEIFKK